MKGLAFAYDPNGYWVELVKRSKEANFPEKFNLGQTMIRVKDADKSLAFYAEMGMTKARRLYECIMRTCHAPKVGLFGFRLG